MKQITDKLALREIDICQYGDTDDMPSSLALIFMYRNSLGEMIVKTPESLEGRLNYTYSSIDEGDLMNAFNDYVEDNWDKIIPHLKTYIHEWRTEE